MKRVKKVHQADQLCHLFCNMVLSDMEDYRTPSNNLYVRNETLYSYGSHYPLATKHRLYEGPNSIEALIINSNRSTVTTEKQKSSLRGALKPCQVSLYVPYVNVFGGDVYSTNEQHLINQIVDSIDSVLGRTKYSSILDIQKQINNLNLFYDLMKTKKVFKLPQDLFDVLKKIQNDKDEKYEVQRVLKLEKEKQFNKRVIEYTRENLESWYLNQHGSLENQSLFSTQALAEYIGHDLCKVQNDEIVTQRGARVPLNVAKTMIKNCWPNGFQKLVLQKIGEFSICSWNDKKRNLEIGCHTINVDQVKKVLDLKNEVL